MGIETKSREIDGHFYEVLPFSATKGLALYTKISAAADGVPDLGKALSTLGGDAAVALTKELLEKVHCDSKPVLPMFDRHFAGRYLHLQKVLQFVMEINFFEELAQLMEEAGQEEAQTTETSDNT
ncbi:MAG TPA: hypothetical protein PKW95_20530 [bacterium]|nr:hypothetical protein [bacterium]